MELVIGRIGKAHGLRGEVTIGIRTDDPDERFAPGAVLRTDPVERGPLTVGSARYIGGNKLVLAFDGYTDRTAAEQLRGIMLVIDSDDLPDLDSDDDFYDHELEGMRVLGEDGDEVGTVEQVIHGAGGDTLAVRRSDSRREVLIPFVRSIVPRIDRAARTMTITPPDGLLEL
ncbi:ribosome maturation factor RimM [Cumulibacter soli]|uniref:ribosome maturation factor RimM n=1 Tax=Cumulibacter soli TaxID=2546344 RepID=UPI0010672949|nr:ribosome maturation factor RimM [Cumulibacter soli]